MLLAALGKLYAASGRTLGHEIVAVAFIDFDADRLAAEILRRADVLRKVR
jgi:hypothetical protein